MLSSTICTILYHFFFAASVAAVKPWLQTSSSLQTLSAYVCVSLCIEDGCLLFFFPPAAPSTPTTWTTLAKLLDEDKIENEDKEE